MLIIRHSKKIILSLVLAILGTLLFSFAYWYKCQLGIDLVPSFSFSCLLPEALQKKVRPNFIFRNETGVLFHEDFESRSLAKNWDWIPIQEGGKIDCFFNVGSLNHFRCLSTINRYGEEWSLQQRRMLEVREGDMVRFFGYIRKRNMSPDGSIGMILFDKKYHVVSVSYARPDEEFPNYWKHMLGECKVPAGVYFLRFMIYGRGRGELSFCDVGFSRISSGKGGGFKNEKYI